VLEPLGVAGRIWLWPLSFLSQKDGLYTMHFENSMGSSITKIVSLSCKTTPSAFGIPHRTFTSLRTNHSWYNHISGCGCYISAHTPRFRCARLRGLHARAERPGWGFILEFYIVPNKRRLGWGRRLFSLCMEILRKQNVKDVWSLADQAVEKF